MEKNLHPNFRKASNLMFGSVVLGIVNMLLISNTFMSGVKIVVAMMVLLFYASIGYAIRLGKNWTKYLLLFLMIFGLLVLPYIFNTFKSSILLGNNLKLELLLALIKVTQIVLQFYAMVLVFQSTQTRSHHGIEL
ncbi:hypothetical protein [Pedobacter immunditicola]|uniref:hypothetical protein n=1 Tax=Pedobacter immunditicola TaxID=3133440 RepID=UPI003095DCD5